MNLKNKVEAILFAVGKKIHIEEIARLSNSDIKQVQKVLLELQKDYESRECSLELSKIEDMWKFNVKSDYLEIVKDLIRETDLDLQTMETLAMIAYLSPVMQSEIVNKRTPAVYDHVKQLEDMGLVTKAKKGRSRELKITEKFYDYFDIDKGRMKQLFDKFEEQDLKIEDQEEELVELEEERAKEQEELQKHIKEKQNPLNLGDELNSLDGGVEAEDTENEYDQMLEQQEEEEKQKAKERRERFKKMRESGETEKVEEKEEEAETPDQVLGREVETLNDDIESLRKELDRPETD